MGSTSTGHASGPRRFSDGGNGHVVVVHRWQDRYAHYTEYFDHSSRPVTYITTAVGRKSVPESAAEVVVLPATSDLNLVREAVADLSRRHGQPAALIALKEGDLPVVSRIRDDLDLVGRRPHDLHRFLDKFVMAQAVADLGLALPEFAMAPDRASVERFAARFGWPVILKPLRGSASLGVRKVRSLSELDQVSFNGSRPMMVEEYLPYPILHVDGFCGAEGVGPWRASRYLWPPLAFHDGAPMGSHEIDDPLALSAVEDYVGKLLPGLCQEPWVFHLELFLDEEDPKAPRCVFMEVGSRVGGADIPWVWREVHGMDLMHAECSLQFGHVPTLPQLHPDEPVGGFVVVPLPIPAPCRVVDATSMVSADGPYAEWVPAPGTVIPVADAVYEHVGGRFRFAAAESAQVEAAIRRTVQNYRVRCQALDPAA